MTTISKAFVRTEFGAVLTPDPPEALSTIKLHESIPHVIDAVASIRFRAFLGGGGNVVLNLASGAISTTLAGTRQVETLTITAAAGATASGTLTATVTHSALTGSPLAIPVQIRTGVHISAALIAAAVREALAGNEAIAELFAITGTGAGVIATALHPAANDATFNLAVNATLGVSAANSANTTAGVAGATFEKVGGATLDMLGAAYPTISNHAALVLSVPYGDVLQPPGLEITDGMASPVVIAGFLPGAALCMSNPTGLYHGPSNELILTCDSRATVDLLMHWT